jgi:urease beta subunit
MGHPHLDTLDLLTCAGRNGWFGSAFVVFVLRARPAAYGSHHANQSGQHSSRSLESLQVSIAAFAALRLEPYRHQALQLVVVDGREDARSLDATRAPLVIE